MCDKGYELSQRMNKRFGTGLLGSVRLLRDGLKGELRIEWI
jgi:hypothetical protein